MPASCQKTSPAKASPKTAFDKATLEAYVRHLYAWGKEVKVEIGAARPSAVEGLSEVPVRASAEGASVEQVFLVSKDGKKIIQGTVYDVTDNPFRADLNKLTGLSGASLGTPGAPVVLVLFTDYQCPYCRVEAQMLRKNLLATYPNEVRLYLQEFPARADPPGVQARGHGRKMIPPTERRRLLELPRLDLRRADPDHPGKPARQGDRLRPVQGR
jgi:protein-disulfide isomerase